MADRITHARNGTPNGSDAQYNEKKDYANPRKMTGSDEEEEDEDMDALIEELESNDGGEQVEEEDTTAQPGGARIIPEEMLQTSTRTGLSTDEVGKRRKKYGLNQMKEEKENLILKFLGFFIGPIQFVMEVSSPSIDILSHH